MADSRIDLEQKKIIKQPMITQAKDTAHMQADYLDTESLANVSVTCRGARTLFGESLPKRTLQKLLQHVVRGEQVQAEAMIRSQPELLFKTDTVIDYSGRTLLNVTPISAAYGADDVDMIAMMFKYLDQTSKDKARDHIKEKFPEEKETKSYDFAPIVAAITANDNVEAALEQFRNDFTPGVIEKGKHFNMKILLAAYEAYNNYDAWTHEQCSLFFRQVIGYLQRLLPACYAQAFCQNIRKVTEDGEPLERNLRFDDGQFFYPLGNSHIGLGFNFGILSQGAASAADDVAGIGVALVLSSGDDLETYIQAKDMYFDVLVNNRTIEQAFAKMQM